MQMLEILHKERRVISLWVVYGKHRLKNYPSVMSVNGFVGGDGKAYTVVLESYIVNIPEGNTGEYTMMFMDIVVKLNLQKLGMVAIANMHGNE
ncbi:abscisic acid receptor pyl2 [Phtheirospermum japonicum]|uniref:Abscisic acid receptor pyl2 n=1 Tax=Phtheirospermum japonicum TaxID=374723 RepID=A0A830DJT7_9LAMI|nr:abscisic acid receptor pyl2 [Phtheirospermum japonicum]